MIKLLLLLLTQIVGCACLLGGRGAIGDINISIKFVENAPKTRFPVNQL